MYYIYSHISLQIEQFNCEFIFCLESTNYFILVNIQCLSLINPKFQQVISDFEKMTRCS